MSFTELLTPARIFQILPFAMLLLAIATFPLMSFTKKLWHHNWFQFVVAMAFGAPVGLWEMYGGNYEALAHAGIEWFAFVTLLGTLFVVSGGIHLKGDIPATPWHNLGFLAIGALLASFIGTTGAAMLLIRPVLMTNRERKYVAHTVVFLIFIIANAGGLLTPLGDPPLFMGYLRGVPFTWTMSLWKEWLFVNAMLMFAYLCTDIGYYAMEESEDIRFDNANVQPLKLLGAGNLLGLLGVVLAVAFLPSIDLHAIEEAHHHHASAPWLAFMPIRELAMFIIAGLSLKLTPKEVRYELNEFGWEPIKEVAALFSGIFLAMIPALKVLKEVAPLVPANPLAFFFGSGVLSGGLDNAPTYVAFFTVALEKASAMTGVTLVAGVPEPLLQAVSLGAVLCGLLTYVGNGPNMMTKAIADAFGVKMPSFFGYMAMAVMYAGPVLLMVPAIFLAEDFYVNVLGCAAAGGYIFQHGFRAYKSYPVMQQKMAMAK